MYRQIYSTQVSPASPVVVEPGDEVCGVPVGVGGLPVPIGPDHVRPVHVHQLIQLRHRLALKHRQSPSQEGSPRSETQTISVTGGIVLL